MASLEEQYNSIVAQLDAFLACANLARDLARPVTHADLVSAVNCITSPNLKAKINEIDWNWSGLRERPAVTLERLAAVVTTIRRGIFCGGGHLFYVVIRSKEKEEGSDCVYPTRSETNTFEYTVHDADAYFVDIKDLSGRKETKTLYTYDVHQDLMTDFANPFNLTQPRLLQMSTQSDGTPHHKFLPYGLRIYAFTVDNEDPDDIIFLKNAENRTVLTLKFQFTPVHRQPGQPALHALLADLQAFNATRML